MSLDPTWTSTMLGLYVIAGALEGGLALVCVSVVVARASERLPAGVSRDHLHALGRVLFAFVVVWAYTAFCQFLLMWIADEPREIRWWLARVAGGLGALGLGVAAGHFAIFAALLSRAAKRHAAPLALAALGVLALHFADLYWLAPPRQPASALPSWLALLAAAAAITGACAALAVARARPVATYPLGAPELEDSIHYEAAP